MLQESDWAGSGTPWNPPTSHTLPPMSNYSFGFRIFMAPSIRERDAWLSKAGRAVIQGIPGMPGHLLLTIQVESSLQTREFGIFYLSSAPSALVAL